MRRASENQYSSANENPGMFYMCGTTCGTDGIFAFFLSERSNICFRAYVDYVQVELEVENHQHTTTLRLRALHCPSDVHVHVQGHNPGNIPEMDLGIIVVILSTSYRGDVSLPCTAVTGNEVKSARTVSSQKAGMRAG